MSKIISVLVVFCALFCFSDAIFINETKINTVTFNNAYTIHLVSANDMLYPIDYNTLNITITAIIKNDCENSFIINRNNYYDNITLNLHDVKLKINTNCSNSTNLTYNAHIMYEYQVSNTTIVFIIAFCITMLFPIMCFIYVAIKKCSNNSKCYKCVKYCRCQRCGLKRCGLKGCFKCCGNEYYEILNE